VTPSKVDELVDLFRDELHDDPELIRIFRLGLEDDRPKPPLPPAVLRRIAEILA
jgi:hypothetical protein